MGDQDNLLRNLVLISGIDSKIAGILAEKKKLAEKLEAKRIAFKAAELEWREKTRVCQERRAVYDREDRHLKDSQQKLVDRRKALTTLGSYKLQMAAEREIEASAKQLAGQEERYVKMLDQMDDLDGAARTAQAAAEALKTELGDCEKEVVEALPALEQRIKEYTDERQRLTPLFDARSMATYDRVRERFPMDPVVPLKSNVCGGCFLALGPQTVVEISRGRALVRCRGCGRILFLEESKEE